jgi:hypothetical protein
MIPMSNTTLSYGGASVTLRSPDFGNSLKLEPTRINRKNRGGDIIIAQDPNWPIVRILTMKFSFQNQDEVNRLLQFLEYSLGQIITLLDFEERTWTGIITTPSGKVSQPAREGFSAELEFQGSLS